MSGIIRKEDMHESFWKEGVSNPNLLINGDFQINQRGNSSYATTNRYIYTFDRWMFNAGIIAKSDLGVKITHEANNYEINFQQYVENIQQMKGKKYTLSWDSKIDTDSDITYLIMSYDSSSNPVTILAGKESYYKDLDVQEHKIVFSIPKDIASDCANLCVRILRKPSVVDSEINIEIGNVKLEEGNNKTMFIPRLYAEELTLCQRYFKIIENSVVIPMAYYFDRDGQRVLDFYLSLATPLRINPTLKLDEGASINIKDLLNDKKINTESTTISNVVAFKNTSSYLNIRVSIPLDTNVKIVSLFPSGGNAYLDAEIY